ncbi:MAG TPA: hypothetical protein VN081_06190 [Dongiaceae bacterium]|nr:hypothetical protein [Dongiaceae bacterium]
MGTRTSHGFTIIETMLFLAVSGILILAMIAGTGASLNIQRYRDAVESFKSLVQQQYSDLNSVQNSRSDTLSCDSNANPVANGDQLPGQTGCFIIGKYMRIDASDVAIYNVLAYQKSTVIQPDDITSLKNNYNISVDTTNVENYTMEWGTQIAWPVSGTGASAQPTPRQLGMLFLRSPDSGLLYTFSGDKISPDKTAIPPATLTNLLVAGNAIPGQGARTICVAAGGLFVKGSSAIYVAPFAGGSSAVEVRSNDYLTSIGQTTQC